VGLAEFQLEPGALNRARLKTAAELLRRSLEGCRIEPLLRRWWPARQPGRPGPGNRAGGMTNCGGPPAASAQQVHHPGCHKPPGSCLPDNAVAPTCLRSCPCPAVRDPKRPGQAL
jgi:hypothetical protein